MRADVLRKNLGPAHCRLALKDAFFFKYLTCRPLSSIRKGWKTGVLDPTLQSPISRITKSITFNFSFFIHKWISKWMDVITKWWFTWMNGWCLWSQDLLYGWIDESYFKSLQEKTAAIARSDTNGNFLCCTSTTQSQHPPPLTLSTNYMPGFSALNLMSPNRPQGSVKIPQIVIPATL